MMKIRDSGMPEQGWWDSFFDAELILDTLGLDASCGNLVEFGCGYGTFTLPAARRIGGTVYALDLDPRMLESTKENAAAAGVENIELRLQDFIADGTGLDDSSMDFAMVFNILHVEDPVGLLREVHRNLAPGGIGAIIHWNYDPETPRGPPMEIRPRPEQCLAWAERAGFTPLGDVNDLPPYHYGLVLRRKQGES